MTPPSTSAPYDANAPAIPKPWTGVSPSQIREFEECERKWFLGSVCHVQTPQRSGAIRGDEIHRQLEAYAETGAQPSDSAAYDAVPFVKDRGPHILTEGRLEKLFPMQLAGMKLRGRFDRLDVGGLPALVHVWDYKSTGRPEYAKKDEQIPADTQAVIYGGWALHRWPSVKSVRTTLLYIPTNGQKPFPRTGEEPRAKILERFGALGAVVERMKPLAVRTDWREVPPNYNTCAKYGGCPHQERCAKAATIREKILMKFGVTKKTENTSNTVVTATEGAVGIVPPDAPKSEAKKLLIPEIGEWYALKDGRVGQFLGPATPGKVQVQVGLDGDAMEWEVAASDLLEKAPAPTPALVNEAAQTEAPATGPDKPKRKPRAPKAEAPAPAPAPVASAPPPVGLTLYIDCAQLKGAELGTRLEDVLHPLAAKICNKEGVADLRLLPYATGKGALAAELRANLPTGEVWCTSGELSDAAIEALKPLADRVIVGVA